MRQAAVSTPHREKTRRTGRASPHYWRLLRDFPLRRIETREQYEKALDLVTQLGQRLDELSAGSASRMEREALRDYLHPLVLLVSEYEKSAAPWPKSKVSARDRLEYLLEEHGLRQSDLRRELGGQPVVSQILSGKRELNLRQIRALARRFHLPPAVFVDL